MLRYHEVPSFKLLAEIAVAIRDRRDFEISLRHRVQRRFPLSDACCDLLRDCSDQLSIQRGAVGLSESSSLFLRSLSDCADGSYNLLKDLWDGDGPADLKALGVDAGDYYEEYLFRDRLIDIVETFA